MSPPNNSLVMPSMCSFCGSRGTHPSWLQKPHGFPCERKAGGGHEAPAHRSEVSAENCYGLFSTWCVAIFRVCSTFQYLGWGFGWERFTIIWILCGERNLGVSSGKGISEFIIFRKCFEDTCPQRYALFFEQYIIQNQGRKAFLFRTLHQALKSVWSPRITKEKPFRALHSAAFEAEEL